MDSRAPFGDHSGMEWKVRSLSDEPALRAMGVEHPHPARLVDVCIRAAFTTSADVRIVPAAVVTDGLAAILRW